MSRLGSGMSWNGHYYNSDNDGIRHKTAAACIGPFLLLMCAVVIALVNNDVILIRTYYGEVRYGLLSHV